MWMNECEMLIFLGGDLAVLFGHLLPSSPSVNNSRLMDLEVTMKLVHLQSSKSSKFEPFLF